MSAEQLITDRLDLWTNAVTYKSGRGAGKGRELTGIKKLRELILELAVRGKLVEQDPNDEPASALLEKIAEEKARLVKEGRIKKSKRLKDITSEKAEFDLPSSWLWTRLDSVGRIVGGGTPKSSEPTYWTDKEIPWLTPADLYGMNQKYIESGKRDISELGLEKSSAQLLPKGSVLFSSRAPIGYVAITAKPLTTNQGFKSCAPYIRGTNHFIYYFLKRSARHIDDSASGTTFKEVSGSKVASIAMPLPPLQEQHRIVAKVDELMALCDRLEEQTGDQLDAHEVLVNTLLDALTRAENADEVAVQWARLAEHFDTLFTTEASIDKLKQAILQLAVMGRLVEQDPNDEPASVLLEKITAEKARLVKEGRIKKPKKLPKITKEEKSFKLPDGWVWTRTGEVYDVRDGTHDTPKYHPKGYPLITSKNISGGYLSFNDVKYISEIDHLKIQERSRAERNDLLLAMIGSIGNPVIVDTDVEFSIKNVAVFKYYKKSFSSPKFLNSFLKKASITLREQSSGGVQSFVSLGKLRGWPIALPPLAEQHRIAKKVDELMTLCDQLKQHLSDASETRTHLAEAVVTQAVK